MPVILPRESEDAWLDRDVAVEAALSLLRPYPGGANAGRRRLDARELGQERRRALLDPLCVALERPEDQVHDQLRVAAQALGGAVAASISTSLARSRRRSLPSRRSFSSTPPMRPWNVV